MNITAKHIPVAYRDHNDAWIQCSCGWGGFGDDGGTWLEHAFCTCPTECDCQDPESNTGTALLSNECPIHNFNPKPNPHCTRSRVNQMNNTIQETAKSIIAEMNDALVEHPVSAGDHHRRLAIIDYALAIRQAPDRSPVVNVYAFESAYLHAEKAISLGVPEERMYDAFHRLSGVLICFCAILFAICIVVFWAWPRLRSDRFDLLSDQNLAKLGPVFPKGIPVNDSRIDDYIGTASIKIGKVLRGYRERLDRSSDDSSVLHLKRLNPLYRYIPNLFDSVVRKDYAASEMAYGSFVVDDGCFIDRQELNSNSSFEATCWGFPYVDQMHRPHVSRIDLQRSAVKCHANPSPLVFSHDAELAVHHMILIYRDSDQGTGKGHNAPISKTGAFNKFSKSHRWFLFLISLPLGAFGGFALILGGIYFAIERPNLCYFLLCILLSTLSFALIFAFAHIVYD